MLLERALPLFRPFAGCTKTAANGANIVAIQQFLAASTPSSTFAVKLISSEWFMEFPQFHLENGITGEELHGTWTEEGDDLFHITRHRAGCNTQEVRKWIMAMTKERDDYRCIRIYDPTIGSMNVVDAAQVDVPNMDEEKQAEQRQPSTSKNA